MRSEILHWKCFSEHTISIYKLYKWVPTRGWELKIQWFGQFFSLFLCIFGGRAHTNHWDSGQWCTSCPQNDYGMLKQSNKHVFVSSLHSQSESGQSLDLDISRSGRHLNFPHPPPLVRRGWGGRWWWRPLFWASPNGYWDISKAQHRTPTELWDRAIQSGSAKCI